MDKKTLEDIKRHVKELSRKKKDFHYIVAEEIFYKLTALTTPLEWSARTENEQPVILVPLRIPKEITDFLDPFTKGTEGAKEKILQALGDKIVNTGLTEGALQGMNIDEDKAHKFMEILKKELGE